MQPEPNSIQNCADEAVATSKLAVLAEELFDYGRPETNGEKLFFRLFELFIVGCVIDMMWYWGAYIMRISDLVLPLGMANYLDITVLYGNGLSYVIASVTTVLVLVGYFRLFRYAYLIAFALMHLQYVTRFSLGEIPHSSNVVGMILLGLSLAMILFEDSLFRRRFTLGFTYFYVGLGYALAAVCKLVATGIFWSDGRHLWIWIHEKAVDAFAYTGILAYNPLQEFALASFSFSTAILTFGLLSEFMAWGMWFRRYRMIVILAVIGLHIGIKAAMNIMFWHTFWVLLLLAFPWSTWIDRILDRSPKADALVASLRG